MKGPLSGIRVLDLSRVFAGPWAAQMLADFGADVIKVEHVKGGDDVRRMGVPHLDDQGEPTGETSSFLAMNRGKRSVAVDLSSEGGREVMLRLVDQADVLIENFKVGNLARFGLDHATVAQRNPRIVYCSITGYGQTGPMRHLPGYDPIFQAMSGVLSVTGMPDGAPGAGPALVGYSISDINAGLYATIGILAALHQRDTGTGAGQYIDIALLDTQIHAASHIAMNWLCSGKLPFRNGTASQVTCPWQAFECSDKAIMIAVGTDAQFRRLVELLGLPELADDPRYATNLERVRHTRTLVPQLAGRLVQNTAAHWFAALEGIGIPSGPINTFADVFEMEQVRHRGLLQTVEHPTAGAVQTVANPVRFSGASVPEPRHPPTLGEHTDAVLAEAGLDAAAIRALRDSGSIG